MDQIHTSYYDAARVASGRIMGRTSPRTTTKERSIAQNGTRPRYRGQGRGGLVAPNAILMLHGKKKKNKKYFKKLNFKILKFQFFFDNGILP